MRIRITQFLNTHRVGYIKFEKIFKEMYGVEVTGRTKRKLKSTYHYIINNDQDTAWKFYLQLQKCLKSME